MSAQEEDPFRWLEEVESAEALRWVQEHNARTLPSLQADPYYAEMAPEIRRIYLAQDRIPSPSLLGGWVYNFWQDAKNVRGVWRRTTLENYEKSDPAWEVVLDLDALARSEDANWVWGGASCLSPEFRRCLISLSPGGKDASVLREFDLTTKKFVEGGFTLPEGKSGAVWKDLDTLLVSPGSATDPLTTSGYPRTVKLWKRGTPLGSAPVLYEGEKDDMRVEGDTIPRSEGTYSFLWRRPGFFNAQVWLLRTDGSRQKIPFPEDAQFCGVFKHHLLALLRNDWVTSRATFPAGSVVSVPVAGPEGVISPETEAELVYAPSPRASVSQVVTAKSHLFLRVLENVNGKLIRIGRSERWHADVVPFDPIGSLSVLSWKDYDERLIVQHQSFLIPSSLYLVEGQEFQPARRIKQASERFDNQGLTVRQLEATSADGTKIPYFIMHRKDLPFDGKTPTVLYGYGGFNLPLAPSYSGVRGKAWLERGGAYAVANIRGGGEFGPQWHKAARRENRQRAYDDFIAVAEHLIATEVTSPRYLGIEGGSNGGLLVGAVMVQRPELFRAVLCEVPLLDMLRYHKLLAGSSWMDEYGNPDEPADAEFLRRYSPYQNVRPGVTYPHVFFVTSTKDDRVHPGHARKMAARMESQGHPVLYFENTDGGHSAGANLEQQAALYTLACTFWIQMLGERKD